MALQLEMRKEEALGGTDAETTASCTDGSQIFPSVTSVQGHLAHKKPPPPPRTALRAWAWSYCRVLRSGGFL